MQGFSQLSLSPGRNQQISDLLSRCISCRPLNRDRSVFEIPLWLTDGRSTALRITLGPTFPQVAPSIAVTSPLKHAKVDAAGQISLPSLTCWDPHSSKLADVVEEACSMVSSADDDWQLVGAASGSSTNPTSSHRDYNSQRLRDSQTASPSGQPPSAQGASKAEPAQDFAELNAFSNEQLVALLTDRTKYCALVNDIMAKSHVAQVRGSVLQSITDMASRNLDSEQLISELRNQIAIVRSSEYTAEKERFDSTVLRQNTVLGKLDPELLMGKLARAGQEAENDAESQYNDFVAGTLPLERFIAQYSKKKGLAHSRNLKSTAAAQTLR